MILHFDVKIKELKKEGKDYLWPRPAACPCCGGKLWGHGYTGRYFFGSPKLWLKRYRCIECHAVHTLRPKTHWRRFQFPLATIIESLRTKIVENLWLKDYPYQRQQYWMRGLGIQLERRSSTAMRITLKHLRSLLVKNIIAATHSLRWFQMIMQSSLTYVPTV